MALACHHSTRDRRNHLEGNLVHLLLKTECLNEHIFGNLAEARKTIENWRIDYNTQRPHTSLGGLAPAVYANLNRATRPASLELRKGSAQQALTATISTEKNRNGFYT
ncbi:transposase [Roseobacter sp. HKCCD8979]|nr:transposase [Roseobacter sp. HKCCD8979]NNX53610.1 transposase [Roseobacter sp. HKCCD9024]NOC43661.1 transposase [Roseobacter sp. HKCCD8882]NOD19850.1 transposase [Roseobacter sp. HKCCD7580]